MPDKCLAWVRSISGELDVTSRKANRPRVEVPGPGKKVLRGRVRNLGGAVVAGQLPVETQNSTEKHQRPAPQVKEGAAAV